jgi:hypothetical protein
VHVIYRDLPSSARRPSPPPRVGGPSSAGRDLPDTFYRDSSLQNPDVLGSFTVRQGDEDTEKEKTRGGDERDTISPVLDCGSSYS